MNVSVVSDDLTQQLGSKCCHLCGERLVENAYVIRRKEASHCTIEIAGTGETIWMPVKGLSHLMSVGPLIASPVRIVHHGPSKVQRASALIQIGEAEVVLPLLLRDFQSWAAGLCFWFSSLIKTVPGCIKIKMRRLLPRVIRRCLPLMAHCIYASEKSEKELTIQDVYFLYWRDRLLPLRLHTFERSRDLSYWYCLFCFLDAVFVRALSIEDFEVQVRSC